MAPSRQALSQAHPAKTNVLSAGLMCVLILIVIMQIWLLSASLNNSLEGHNAIEWPPFGLRWSLVSRRALWRSVICRLPIRLPVVMWMRGGFYRCGACLAHTSASVRCRLALAFAVWFMWSAIAVKLNDAGFGLSQEPAFLADSHAGASSAHSCASLTV